MKRTVASILSLALALSIPLSAYAHRTKQERNEESTSLTGGVKLKGFVDKGLPAPIVKAPETHPLNDRINVKVDDLYVHFYYKPVIDNGRTLMPFREVFELFDMKVSWDDVNKKATAEKDGIKIEITLGESKAFVNGEEKQLDVPAKIINESTYIPVRFIAESLGYQVNWKDEPQTVIINTVKGGGF